MYFFSEVAKMFKQNFLKTPEINTWWSFYFLADNLPPNLKLKFNFTVKTFEEVATW
jgi:hypothetical protein